VKTPVIAFFLRDTEKFELQLYIYIGKLLKLATCYFNRALWSSDASTSRDRIFLIVVLIFVEATLLGIAAMKLDDDFKNINISKHAQLLVVRKPFKG
jgi:hypothetical protein